MFTSIEGSAPYGLDYSALQAVMAMLAIPDISETFKKVQFIEHGFLDKIHGK